MITPAMIRRFPFAVNPARITAQDEAWIALHMRAAILGAPRSTEPEPQRDPEEDEAMGQRLSMMQHALQAKARRKYAGYIDRIGDRAVTSADVERILGQSRDLTQKTIRAMIDRGLLEVVGKEGKNRVYQRKARHAPEVAA